MENIIEVEKNEPKCNCNDEFVTTHCPVHFTKKTEGKFGEDSIEVDDKYIVGYGTWSGFIFTCPGCGKAAIMVNPDMGHACYHCLKRVNIRSKTVTNYIKRYTR